MSMVAKFVLVGVIGYLLGAIPFGVLVSRWKGKVDITKVGSGKTGMTNVLRVAGKKAAALVATLDLSKGALAVIVAGLILNGDYVAQVIAALAAIMGHNWSVFVKFRGGRGVATFLGGLLVLFWPAAIFGGVVLIIVAGVTRYMSLGSITGAVAAFLILIPFITLRGEPVEYLIYTLISVIFIIIMHRDNIARLLAGKERKLGERASSEGR
jgi:glycerol-3-phosphate acyltransferase PlsY